MKNVRSLLLALVALTATSVALPAGADTAPVHTGLIGNVGVGGYDPVAYFTENRAVRGTTQHRITHQGVEYRFANAANLAAFRATPARYLPQYGGYCAWAVGNGYTAPGDPRHWRIVDGRLFLNYNGDVQRQWDANRANLIRQADTNWPGVLSR